MFKKFISQFESEALSKYMKNTSWMLFERIFRLGVTALIGIYVANYLKPARFGQLSYALSFVMLLGSFASLGLRNIVLKELSNTNDKDAKLTSTSTLLHLIGSVLAIVIIVISTFIGSKTQEQQTLVWVVAVMLPFQALLLVDIYFQAKVLAKYSSWVFITATISSSIFKLALIWLQADIIWFAWAMVIEQAIPGLMLLIMGYKRKVLGFRSIDFSIAPKLLKDGSFFLLASVATVIYMRIDQVMLLELAGDEENGLYAAAVRFSEAAYFLPVVIANSLMPAIANLQKGNQERYIKRFQQFYDMMVWVGIGLAFILYISSDFIVDFFLKDEFSQSAEILAVHAWALVFVFIGVAHDKWLIQEGSYHLAMWKTMVGGIMNIILNLLLIKPLGGIGAAYATVISYMAASYFVNLLLPNSFKSFYMHTKAFLLPFRVILHFAKTKL